MTLAGFWYVPAATAAATLAMNVSDTLPPPGMSKLDHEGVAVPTTGSTVEGRAAPPAKTTDGVLAYVKFGLLGNTSARATLCAVERFAALATVIV